MIETNDSKKYDLEDRTLEFAKNVRDFLKKLPKTTANIEYSRQLIRSSGSTGANYIEANESFSKKDFILRVKICRKEVKESRYWLNLIETGDLEAIEKDRKNLIHEATELMNIFGAIIRKSEKR